MGKIIWTDLTVPNADEVRGFYAAVTGWKPEHVEMGDYNMLATDGTPSAGVCRADGVNANLPPQWLIYITVADLDASIAECQRLGGSIIDGPRAAGNNRMCVIRDPVGAVAALYE
ncbi:MAG: VOC family protein [Anaerolineae bacterium]|nr:VOC family protein [Anaerolineae bacterium]